MLSFLYCEILFVVYLQKSITMKTKLLKRLRKQAGRVCAARYDRNAGAYIVSVNNTLRWRFEDVHAAIKHKRAKQRDYIMNTLIPKYRSHEKN